jgi:mono/diheme cytochrome c family protein
MSTAISVSRFFDSPSCTGQESLNNSFRNLRSLKLAFAVVLTLTTSAHAQVSTPDNEGEQFFADKIEPLLKAHCLECHSHAANEMSGGLTLDSRSGWSTGGARGPVIVPEKPEESLLIKAIRHDDPNLKMPPDEKLSAANIELLTEWIRRGAPDPRQTPVTSKPDGDPLDWWSLRPLIRPDVPVSTDNNPIDHFILQQLQQQQLTPVPAADRRTLIRRVYFDLHGLPPEPDAVTAFVADPDPEAYEKLVDRLLASERYGERWARHWLDTVHFADSHGCEHDVFRPHAWRYRDYVIASLNSDTPWDRFIREQLAADRFYPNETRLTAALGFIGAGPLELSRASTAPVTFDYLDRDDMVGQTMSAFASTTANCARCHDHKFDPVSQEDYYSLQAVFAGTGKGDVEFDDDPDTASERQRWQRLRTAATANDASVLLAAEYADIVSQWEDKFATASTAWETLAPLTFVSSGGATLQRLDDNSLLASGNRPDTDTYSTTASTALHRLTALRLDVLIDDSLPMRGPGRQDNGNLHLTEFEASVFHPEDAAPTRLKFNKATTDFDQAGWTGSHAIDGNSATAWGIHPAVGQSHTAVFNLETPFELKSSSQIVVELKQLHGTGHLIGRWKLSATDTEGITAEVLPELVRSAVMIPREQRTPEQKLAVAAHALSLYADQQLALLPAVSTVYAVSTDYSHGKKLDQPQQTPKAVHVLHRGDIEKPGDVAVPGALSAITSLPGRFTLNDANDEAARRVALADWLAARDNPLTWRSIVNRVWSHHFGRGLCDTPNDFGRMGGIPSHPELLNWLAVWFRDDARGSLKQLHRLIVLSAAWQRQSNPSLSETPDPQLVDAENRLLWRGNRQRLDAESFRDALLQISGRLDLTMGGPGIQQFTTSTGSQLTPKLHYDAFDWNSPAAARRSIYRVVWRGITDPFMESLDFPDMGQVAPQRGNSVSSLQALTFYNNDFVLHHSQVLAERIAADHMILEEQVLETFRRILLRDPGSEERTMLVEYAEKHGLTAMCRVLFNSNEFVFVD